MRSRLLSPVVPRLSAEVRGLLAAGAEAVRGRRVPVVTVVLAVATMAAAAGDAHPAMHGLLMRWGGVYADQGIGTELARLPGSVVLPTFDCPLWAALLQLVAVVGLAEVVAGWWRTLVVAGVGQLVSTLSTRVLVGHGGWWALPASQAHVLDTGPSGVCVAVGAYLLLRRRAPVAWSLLAVSLSVAAVLQRGDLDGTEHEVALLAGTLAFVAPAVLSLAQWRARSLALALAHRLRGTGGAPAAG